MTALDIFVFLLIIGGGAVGVVRGFVHEVISLLAWIVAVAMLKLFHSQLWGGIENSFHTSTAASAVLAFAILFIPSFLIVKLLAWIVAVAMLKLFHSPLWGGIENSFHTSTASSAVLAFAILFIPSFLIVKLLARSLGGKTRRHAVLGPIDRLLGGGFGALKGLLGATLFFLLANLATDMVYGPQADRPQWMTKSRTYPLLNASGRAIVDWVEARRLHPAPVGRSK